MNLSDFEEHPIIGTERYEPFQRMVSSAGDFAVYEAKQAGLPVTGLDADRNIVKEYPDGRREIIGKAPPKARMEKLVWTLTEDGWV